MLLLIQLNCKMWNIAIQILNFLQLNCYLSAAIRIWIEYLLPSPTRDGFGGQHHHRCDYFSKPSGPIILRCFLRQPTISSDYLTIITIIGPTNNGSDASPKSTTPQFEGLNKTPGTIIVQKYKSTTFISMPACIVQDQPQIGFKINESFICNNSIIIINLTTATITWGVSHAKSNISNVRQI